MHRLLFHILFWAAYLSLRSFIEYLWLHGTLRGFSDNDYILAATLAATLESLPEVFFAYYLSYRVWPQLEKRPSITYWYIIESTGVLLICIYMTRLVFYYIIAPYILKGLFPVSENFEFKRFMVILFNFIATSGIMIAIKSVRHQLDLKERQKELLKEKLETELKMLRNQINPHFLFNTLNNIYGLAIKGSEKTPQAVMKLSELLNFTLYRTGSKTIAIEEEIRILQDYMDLERLRFDDRLDLKLVLDVDNPQQQVTPLIFLPLAENAFKHGAGNSRFRSFIYITVQLKQGMLHLNIANSFESTSNSAKQQEQIGLQSTRRQLELTYKKHDLTVDKSDRIYTINLIINLNSYDEA